MNALKEKVKRRFSIKDKHEPDYSADEADEETNQALQREIDEAEQQGHAQGKPGGFLHKLIAHGNKKTEEQLARDAQRQQQQQQNDVQGTDYASKDDGVIR